ncbi:MAG: hypothetical protein K8S16_13980, partial [Bacteroidales bacterium]|nr:hypothetical protein [Bacteroidales bacterium]
EVSLKRYKYVGKERDDETGLYYYGARYYAAWIARFVSVDPLQHKYPHYTPYQYAGNKPISYIDLDGLEEAKPENNSFNQKPNNLPVVSPNDRFTNFMDKLIPKPKGNETPQEMEKIMDQQKEASNVVTNTTTTVDMMTKGTAAVGIGVLAFPVAVEGTMAAIPYIAQGANASLPYLAQGALKAMEYSGKMVDAANKMILNNPEIFGGIAQTSSVILKGPDPITLSGNPTTLTESIKLLFLIGQNLDKISEGIKSILPKNGINSDMVPIPLNPPDNTNFQKPVIPEIKTNKNNPVIHQLREQPELKPN